MLHIRYTARQGVNPAAVKTALGSLFQDASQSTFALLFSLPHDFPSQWSAFVNGPADLAATIRRDHFPYFTQGKPIKILGYDLYGQDVSKHHEVANQAAWDAATADLGDPNKQAFTVAIGPDAAGPMQVVTRTLDAEVFLVIRYALA